ncbi:hypothetical protein LJC38_02865 [Parabacteroides sp. OttesenSCG-928-K15]|nr:hypothetical protein [Parabacteroides sp. OttesenSCG-928-K15]
MKRYIYLLFPVLFTSLLLLLAVGVSGCDNESDDGMEKIPLKYEKCPCDHKTEKHKDSIIKENVLLFDIAKTSWGRIEELFYNSESDVSGVVIFDSDSKTARYHSNLTGYMALVGHICNFPESMFYMDISADGLEISFKGDVFDLCEPADTSWQTVVSIVLTSMKIQVK